MRSLALLSVVALAFAGACAPKSKVGVTLPTVAVAQTTSTPTAPTVNRTPAPAATPAAGGTPALPKEALKPIDVDADVVEFDAKEKKGTFRGNVVARQGDVTVRAMRVEAIYAKQEGANTTTISKAVAEGGVTVTSGTKVGKADRAEFNNDQRTIVLSGEPRLWEEGSLLEGREIVFHVDDGRVECFECSIDVDPTRLQEMQDDIRRTPTAPGQ